MKTNDLPAAATLVQFTVPCQWLTSMPSRWPVVAFVVVEVRAPAAWLWAPDDALAAAVAPVRPGERTRIDSAAPTIEPNERRRAAARRRGAAAGGRRDT